MLAAILAITPVTPAFAEAAATPAYDAKVSVTGLAENDVAHFYQIVEWKPTATDNVGGWVATSAFASVLTPAVLKAALVGDPTATPPVSARGITAELAGKLATAAASATATDVTVPASGTAELNTSADGAAGLYMALVTPASTDTVYNAVFVASDFNKNNGTETWVVNENATYSDSAAAKKSTVTLEKTADATEENWQDKNWRSTRIGEKVDFTVTTTIPGYGKAFEAPFFKISDKLTDLTLVAGSVTITAPQNLPTGAATVVEGTADYSITFSADYLKTLTVPTAVTIKYSAIVASTAPLHVNLETNEVWTEFSHDPSNQSDHKFKKDDTEHYTFTLDAEGLGLGQKQQGQKTSEIVKVGLDAAGNPINNTTETSTIDPAQQWKGPLADAEFKLYTDQACANEYVPLKTDGTAGTAQTFTTGADGRMTIAGLDAGTYYLREEKAPDGFIKDSHVAKIEISIETEAVSVTEYTKDGVTWLKQDAYDALQDKTGYKSATYSVDKLKTYTVKIDGVNAAVYHFTNTDPNTQIDWTVTPPVELPHQFKNTQGVELPSTGGMGTRILYTIGGIMLVGGAIALVSKKRAANME